MKRRVAAVLLVPLMASCSVVEALGPHPDRELARLADQAHADGRTTDAAELEAEIARLCGTHEDGRVPASCDYSPTPVTPEDAFRVTVDAVDAVPAESRDLLARQATALAGPELAPAPALDPAAAAQARDLLRAEYATAYGLETARAFVPAARVDPLLDTSATRIAALRTALAPTADVPVAEPGYELTGAGGVDEGFVEKLTTDLQTTWLRAVADARDDDWRAWLAHGAAHIESAM